MGNDSRIHSQRLLWGSTLQLHSAAPSNGASTQPPKRTRPKTHRSSIFGGTLQRQQQPSSKVHTATHPAAAPCSGTSTQAPKQQHPKRTQAPLPILEVRTPIALTIWGKKRCILSSTICKHFWKPKCCVFRLCVLWGCWAKVLKKLAPVVWCSRTRKHKMILKIELFGV